MLAFARTGAGMPVHTRRSRIPRSTLDPTIIIDETDVRVLALRAIDAAKAAGAGYADVRLTRTLDQAIKVDDVFTLKELHGHDWRPNDGFLGEGEELGIGIRVFVDGCPGFASSPYWETAEVDRLAQEAVRQAKANARGGTSSPAWAPAPPVTGKWSTPVTYDPFVISIEEKLDFMASWCQMVRAFPWSDDGRCVARFTRQERALATSNGTYVTQTLFSAEGSFRFRRDVLQGGQRFGDVSAQGLRLAGAGWEYFLDANIPEQIPHLFEQALESSRSLPVKPGDIGRYDVVLDAETMSSLVETTIGTPTQVDRALGYEANASGTSYLGPDPLALLGNFQVASPLVTVTANRSMPRGLGTVKWDDEGVEPDEFPLVQDGILVDYQTTREQAAWLAPWYQKQGKPVRSHGCAAAQDATFITMQYAPNLVLEPSKQNVSFDDLVADTKKGLAMVNGGVRTDFQGRTGTGRGMIREIVNGKLGAEIAGLAFLFSTTQLWKNVKALGGAGSVEQFDSGNVKGEPAQLVRHSVRSIPAKIVNVDFIDPRRKA